MQNLHTVWNILRWICLLPVILSFSHGIEYGLPEPAYFVPNEFSPDFLQDFQYYDYEDHLTQLGPESIPPTDYPSMRWSRSQNPSSSSLPIIISDDLELLEPVITHEDDVFNNKGDLAMLIARQRQDANYDDDDDDDDDGWEWEDEDNHHHGYSTENHGYLKDWTTIKAWKKAPNRGHWDYSGNHYYKDWHKYLNEDGHTHPLDKYGYSYPKFSAGLAYKYGSLKHKLAHKKYHHGWGW